MWSNGFSCAIEIRPGWSPANLLLSVVPALAGLLGLGLAGLQPGLSIPAAIAGGLAGGWSAWRATPWSRQFISRLVVSGPGEWRLYSALNGPEVARLAGHWIFADGLAMGLAFETAAGRRRRLVLFCSALPAREWRRLLVRVRRD